MTTNTSRSFYRPRNKSRNPANAFLIQKFSKLKLNADIRKQDHQSLCYQKIITSISKYPLPIICQQQALMLEGVGKKMGALILSLVKERYSAYIDKNMEDKKYQEAVLEEETQVHNTSIGNEERQNQNQRIVISTSRNNQMLSAREVIITKESGIHGQTEQLILESARGHQDESQTGIDKQLDEEDSRSMANPTCRRKFPKLHQSKRASGSQKGQSLCSSRFGDDSRSVASVSVRSRNYTIKDQSPGFYFLSILQKYKQSFLSKKEIKKHTMTTHGAQISSWTFVKTLENHGLIESSLENDTNQQVYKITEKGIGSLQNFGSKKVHETLSMRVAETLSELSKHSLRRKQQEKAEVTRRIVLTREDLTEYRVKLYIDSREVKNKSDREYFKQKLSDARYNIDCEVKPLAIGDFAWVIESDESIYVLDYIIQRKIADDLACSIVDGRYKQQKFRLKNSGLKNVYYLFQGHPSKSCVLPQASLQNAMIKTGIKQGFKVVKTADINQTLRFLIKMHQHISSIVKKAEKLEVIDTFEGFTTKNAKSNITTNNMLGMMVRCLPKMGKTAATQITEHFRTFHHMYDVLRQLGSTFERELMMQKTIRPTAKQPGKTAQILVEVMFGEDASIERKSYSQTQLG